ncbi:MAG: glycosyltransferase [Flavobacteriales bacterium]
MLNPPLRIVHLSSAHPDHDVRIFFKECCTLAAAFPEVEIHLILAGVQERKESGVFVHSVPKGSGNRIQSMRRTVDHVLKKAIALNAAVYHLHDPELLRIAGVLQRHGAKVVFDSHEDVPKQIMDKPWIPTPFRIPLSRMYSLYERWRTKPLEAVVSVTPKICNRFRAFHSNVVMVANFPSKTEFKSVDFSVKRPGHFCYIGGLFETRGIREMVQAMDGVEATLHVAGLFANSELEAEVRQMPGWNKVVYYGQVNRDKIQEILSISTVGLVTLHPTPSYQEAYPIKLFEYMASGCAILSSDFSEYRSLLAGVNAARFVNPLEVSEIRSSLCYFLDHPEETLAMGHEAQKGFYSKYNWETEASKLTELYHRLLAS